MKKLTYLLASLLLLGATFMISCTKTSETPQDLKPTINFKGGGNYISQDATLDISQDFTIGITASANATSGTKLASLYVSRTYNNAIWFDSTFTFSEAYIDYDFQFTSITVEGTERIAFKVTDKDGQTNEVSLSITTQHAAGLINFFTQKILGSYDNLTTGSSFASVDGTVYNLADAKTHAEKIDWLYFYGTTNQATIASPFDSDARSVYPSIETWSVKNATLFKKITTAVDWASIADDTPILQLTADGVTESKVNQLAVGDILGFITVTGKHGLIKIDAIVTGSAGTITFSVKVQQ
jgi:hypothetical protein